MPSSDQLHLGLGPQAYFSHKGGTNIFRTLGGGKLFFTDRVDAVRQEMISISKKENQNQLWEELKEQKIIKTYIAKYVKPNLVVKIACKDTWKINTNIYFTSYSMSYVESDFSDIFKFKTS